MSLSLVPHLHTSYTRNILLSRIQQYELSNLNRQQCMLEKRSFPTRTRKCICNVYTQHQKGAYSSISSVDVILNSFQVAKPRFPYIKNTYTRYILLRKSTHALERKSISFSSLHTVKRPAKEAVERQKGRENLFGNVFNIWSHHLL